MTHSNLPSLLHLRLCVGFLGERSQFGWWQSSFFGASSRPFLEPVFTKTFRPTQYHGVLEAARRLHDEHLSVGSFHLFRLPEEFEQDIHELAMGELGEKIAVTIEKDTNSALEFLRALSSTKDAQSEGPVAIGKIGDIYSSKTIEMIASKYLGAFSKDAKVFPYLAR